MNQSMTYIYVLETYMTCKTYITHSSDSATAKVMMDMQEPRLKRVTSYF